ncbi:MAG: Flp pilus assembly protein CpaB [Gammaproteobacteria bacterium]|nr:Flp pilus assembly protein CpaB [Gammaproteobacteria bacterium]MCP5135559.1 Flp pilus assembly protein CpaB [Gammaproteobacteria bacterium]
MRTILLLIVAISAAVAAALGAQSWLAAERGALIATQDKTAPEPSTQVEGTEVLVAARNLEPGSFVHKEDLKWQVWPKEGLNPAYLVKTTSKPDAELSFDGAVPTRSIPAGQPIYSALLISPGERGFLAAALNPGMRAVTLPVNATTGLAGLVLPGDQVDLILSRDLEGYEGRKQHVSQTVLADVRVLAVDQSLRGFDPGESKAEETVKSRTVLPAKTITVEVTPKQAEKVSLALAMGSLSLSLRSIVENDAALSPDGFTADNVFPTPARPKAPKESDLGRGQAVTVLRGSPAGAG